MSTVHGFQYNAYVNSLAISDISNRYSVALIFSLQRIVQSVLDICIRAISALLIVFDIGMQIVT